MRPLLLHARTRDAGWTLLGVIAVGLCSWLAGDWMLDRPDTWGAASRVHLTAACPVLAVLILASGLRGADDELERTTSVPWRRWRMVHVLLATAVVSATLALGGLPSPARFGAYADIRNTLGYLGLLALGAVVAGSRLAWTLVIGWAAVTNIWPMDSTRASDDWTLAQLMTWSRQPTAATPTWLLAGALFTVGVLAYAATGQRLLRRPDRG